MGCRAKNRLRRFPADYAVSTHAPRTARKARHLKTSSLFLSVLAITFPVKAAERSKKR